MAGEEMQIEWVDPTSIKAYERNAKLHPQWQIDQIKESIKEFGFRDPVALWHDEIVEGHGRREAAIQMGLTAIPVVRLDDMTDEQRRAYMLVHNQTTMNSGWDDQLLDLELDDITDIDMSVFGFAEEVEQEVKKKAKEDHAEVEFTEVLGEEHNYVVLYFDNTVDWLQLLSVLDVEDKMNLSTRRDGKITSGFGRIAKGRVFNGAKALERMRTYFENLN